MKWVKCHPPQQWKAKTEKPKTVNKNVPTINNTMTQANMLGNKPNTQNSNTNNKQTPLIKCVDVTKSVHLVDGEELKILLGVNLTVAPGEHLSIVGRSGSGKSTLLNLLGLLDTPTTGTIHFHEQNTTKLSTTKTDRLRGNHIGFIFQQFNLLQGRTALENTITPLLYSTGPDYYNRKNVAKDMLDRVGLSHRLNSMPEQLSGGEQQRVSIARALVRKPSLILADEPTGALDVETGQLVLQLLTEIAHETGAALITITHDVEVAELADRILRMNNGKLYNAENGKPDASNSEKTQ